MKRKFKPGDVVVFSQDARLNSAWYPTCLRINGPGPFVISGNADHDGLHLSHPDGKQIKWHDDFKTPRSDGFSGMWLERDKFLTAVHKAQKRKEK